LTVAIEREAGVDSYAAALVQAAITEWQGLLRSRAGVSETFPADEAPFGIRYVQESRADIVFVLKQRMPGKALGETNVLYADGVLLSARVEMAVSSAEGLPLDRADIQNIAAHEFGHALGLGHNPDPDDLMYYEYQFVLVRRPIAPSDCDVETLLAGYRTDGFATPNDSAELSVFACA
jgi:predicted Zn-dependent protease